MITYKNCSVVPIKDIVDAFNIGFSDYIIKLQLTEDLLLSRFIRIEQNSLERSYIAYDDDLPIGLILGGIKDYEGIKTLRCGTLCIHPEYRKQGVASKLFNLHKEEGIKHHCKRLFLEVIQGNDKAINFYLKQGYRIMNNLLYYTHPNAETIKSNHKNDLEIKKIDLDLIEKIHQTQVQTHLHWQNDFDYMKYYPLLSNFGLFINESLIGVISLLPSGKIFYLWIDPKHRRIGYAKALLTYVVNEFKIPKLNISFIESEELGTILSKLGFIKDSISQYEMVLPYNI